MKSIAVSIAILFGEEQERAGTAAESGKLKPTFPSIDINETTVGLRFFMTSYETQDKFDAANLMLFRQMLLLFENKESSNSSKSDWIFSSQYNDRSPPR